MSTRSEQRAALNTRIASVSAHIAALQAELSQLLADRNSLESIGSLPPEVLAEVFKLVPGLPHDALMLVCRRWHDVCVSTAALWNHIDLAEWDTRRIAVAARYAGNRVFSIRVELPAHKVRHAAVEQLRSLAPELRALDVCLRVDATAALVDAMNAGAFPHLSTLVISRYGVDDSSSDSGSEHSEDDPEPLSLAQMPILRSLRVVNVAVNLAWQCPVLSILQDLDLDGAYPLPFDILLAFLETCPDLRSLKVKDSLDGALSMDAPRSVHLEKLTVFLIDDDDLIVPLLLNNLSISPTARISVGCLYGSPMSQGTQKFVSAHLQAARDDPFTTLRLALDTLDTPYVYELCSASNDGKICLGQIAGSADDQHQYFSTPACPTVTELLISSSTHCLRRSWQFGLVHFPNITKLTVLVDEGTTKLLQILISGLREASILPLVTHISIVVGDIQPNNNASAFGFVAPLIDFLRAYSKLRKTQTRFPRLVMEVMEDSDDPALRIAALYLPSVVEDFEWVDI